MQTVALGDLPSRGVSCLFNRHREGQVHRKSAAEDLLWKFTFCKRQFYLKNTGSR